MSGNSNNGNSATITTTTTTTKDPADAATMAATKGNFYDDAKQLRAAVRKMFCSDDPIVLAHLLRQMPSQWKNDHVVCKNILEHLDNLFACAYEDERNADCIASLLPMLVRGFQRNEMLAHIECGYVLNCLNRGGCTWIPQEDCYTIDAAVNQTAIKIAGMFLDFFIETPCPQQRKWLLEDIVAQMRDAALVGNWMFYEALYGFSRPFDVAVRCHEECCHLTSCTQRQRWLDRNWPNNDNKARKH
jgi:hypothetical protein